MDTVQNCRPGDFYHDERKIALLSLNHEKQYLDTDTGDEFMEILENGKITTVFQPIISLKDAKIMGYEALSRGPENSMFESPCNLFDFARIYGKLWELEFLCRIKALETLAGKNIACSIFLNVDPNIIKEEKFKKGFTKEFLKEFHINPEKIVFEITEKNSIYDLDSFKRVIENYKDQGYKIAIDDTGTGYSGLKLITDIHPHFIKLDMNLVRNIDKDGLKYALIKTLYEFCLVTDIKLIAEGIETGNELNALIDIGINYGQGYFIQKPSKEVPDIKEEIADIITSRNRKKSMFYSSKSTTIPVGDICSCNITISPSYTGSKVLELFGGNPSIYGIPVIDGKNVAGLIMKDKFYSRLGTQYGFALFLNRPITLLMDKRPLTVEYEATLDVVSKLAMTRSHENLYDYILVIKDSNYYGVVTVKDLLDKTTQLEVNYAKHLNPLSGLPGNVLIEQKLKELIKNPYPYTVLYIDMDNFKIYNDKYGFENGDRMIQFLGRTISDNVMKDFTGNKFVGHIGGDDFIITVDSHDAEKICTSIINLFEAGLSDFYTAEDFQRQYIIAKNRQGVMEQCGLVSLSIAGVNNKSSSFKDVFELAEYASSIKAKCKQICSSCFCIE